MSKCPKCGEDEFEVRCIHHYLMGDTDIATCMWCGFESSEGHDDWDEISKLFEGDKP